MRAGKAPPWRKTGVFLLSGAAISGKMMTPIDHLSPASAGMSPALVAGFVFLATSRSAN